MKTTRSLPLLCAGLLLAAPALADTAAIERCRQIARDAERLRCYDAIAVTPAPRSAPAAAPSAATAPAAAAAPAAPTPTAEQRFGLPLLAQPPAQAETLESRIDGSFDGWSPGSRIRLANGQEWEVTDGTEGVYNLRNPKVTISRGMLGSFFMRIEGVSQTPRVRRLR